MKGRFTTQPFRAQILSTDSLPKLSRKNTFFDLIFVLDGTGRQIVNGNEFQYKPGNLFLLTPEDSFRFEPLEATRVFSVQFDNDFVRDQASSEDSEWLDRMRFVLVNASHQPGCILKNQTDKPVVRELIESVLREERNEQLFFRRMIDQIVNTLLIVVARNLSMRLPERINISKESTIHRILQHIHHNIYEPNKLTAERLGRDLGISSSYIGRYFKKHTGETLQDYITQYRLRLVESRLLHTNLRVNAIAYEMNFTDESHLNRLFKRYRGVSPARFRREARQSAF
ncbi:MAG: AraC family transcriptional regulator [Pyrinomonadaceae bacterium]